MNLGPQFCSPSPSGPCSLPPISNQLQKQLHHLHTPYLQGSKSGTYPSGAIQAYHHLPTPRMSRESPEKSGITSCIGWIQLYLLEHIWLQFALQTGLARKPPMFSEEGLCLLSHSHPLQALTLHKDSPKGYTTTLPALALCQCRPLPLSCEGKGREEEEESLLLNTRSWYTLCNTFNLVRSLS